MFNLDKLLENTNIKKYLREELLTLSSFSLKLNADENKLRSIIKYLDNSYPEYGKWSYQIETDPMGNKEIIFKGSGLSVPFAPSLNEIMDDLVKRFRGVLSK